MGGATVGFSVTVGKLRARWPASDATLDLIALESATGVGGGWARLELGPPQGDAPVVGDAVTIELDDGTGSRRVFTGEVDHTGSTPTAWRLRAHDGLPRLARIDLERVWTDTTADAVIKDLLAAAKLKVAAVCEGPALRLYTALKGPRGLRLVEGLLARMGAELFIDGDGAVVVATPKTGAAAHTLTWGEDLLDLQVARCPPALPGVEVRGEGASDALGASKGHWLPKDVSALVGRAAIDEAGAVVAGAAGQPGFTIVDGALATAKVCKAVAEAQARLLASRAILGAALALGRAAIRPGERLAIAGLPKGHSLAAVLAGESLRARRVIHRFDATAGFTTRVEF